MTARTEREHRRAEARARMETALANRSFRRRPTGLDRLAQAVVRKAAGPPRPEDPDLRHD